jgi:hypothetical protein
MLLQVFKWNLKPLLEASRFDHVYFGNKRLIRSDLNKPWLNLQEEVVSSEAFKLYVCLG